MISHSELKRMLPGAVSAIKAKVKDREEKYKNLRFSYEGRLKEFREKEQRVSALAELFETKHAALDVLNTMSKLLEETSIRRSIEKILQKIVESIFQCDDFRYVFQSKLNRNQKELYLYKQKIKDGKAYLLPINNVGGGARDIIDIIIRILVLRRCPETQRVLILDEPLKNLSKDLRKQFFDFVKKLCESFKIQFIMITHETEYLGFIDNVFRLTHDGTKTVIE